MTTTKVIKRSTADRRAALPARALVLLAVFFGVALMSSAEEQKVSLPLKEMVKAARATTLDRVETQAEIAKTQPHAAEGLRVTVVFANRGKEPVRFLDPRDTTQVMLLDQEGWPIEVPRRAPGSLVNERGKHDDPAVITLEPGQEHRLSITVKEVLPRGKEGATDARTPQPIRAGAYDVKVTSTVIGADAPANGARPSRTFSMAEPFTVHLGV